MELQELISNLIVDTKGLGERLWDVDPTSSIGAFRSEIVICITIVVMLLLRLFGPLNKLDRIFSRAVPGGFAAVVAFFGVFIALALSDPFTSLSSGHAVQRMEIFTGMLVADAFTIYIRSLLLLFALLFIIFTSITGIPDRDNSADIFTLVLGATLGMCLMASANHLMMVFMAVEMASVPSYVLAGMIKGRRQASEAALKYAIYGAGAAGVLLYGISLIAGVANSAHLPTIAVQLSGQLGDMPATEMMAIVLGSLLIMAGLAFKLSAFPFHFWAPDVFEGASAEVGAFLSVASKAGALALLVRVAIGFSTPSPEGVQPSQAIRQVAAADAVPHQSAMFNLADEPAHKSGEDSDHKLEATTETNHGEVATARQSVIEGLAPSRAFMGRLIGLFAVLSCTFGNLAAYGQTNIKRLLSYSTIAHAGYMMMAVPAMIALIGVDTQAALAAASGLSIYIAIYLFMNLGAFAVVAFLRDQMRSEEIADYAGLIKRCPKTVVCFSLILFSLVGLPPLAGFVGKFAIFASLAEGYRSTSQFYLLALLVIGGANTAISLFYYLRVVKVMTMDPEPESRTPFSINATQGVFIFAVTAPTVVLMINWEWLATMADAASKNLM